MTTLMLRTKVFIPPPQPGWVPRPRLLERLDHGLGRRLTLVSAPAGFGKTTLIASWLHRLLQRQGAESDAGQHSGLSVAWLTIEREDNDPVRFFNYFIAALQSICPGAGVTALPFLDTPHLPAFDHLMTLLLGDLAALEGRSLFVLDDYHFITHAELQSAVSFFLEHLPSNHHLVIATRQEPSLPLPRLRMHSEITEIRLLDLRFTSEETADFLARGMGLAATAEAAQILEDRTDGWAAALQMAALSLRGRQGQPNGSHGISLHDELLAGSHRDIIDYLAAEVLKQQPAEIRAWLYQTGILDRLNASLCDAVTGRRDSEVMLDHLEKANLFLIPLDDRRECYRYHHLFADFLRTQLSEPDQHVLHARASQWYLASGMPTEAINHALSAGDPAAAVRVIRRNAEETLRNGGFTTVLGWLDALPEQVVRAHTDLLVHKGWLLYLRGEVANAETYARLAVENNRPDDPPLHRGMLLVFRAYLASNSGQFGQAVKLAQESYALLSQTESYYRTSTLFHLGQAQHLLGDQQAAIQTLRQCIAIAERLGHHLIGLGALGYLTQSLSEGGQLREAILLCEDALSRRLNALGQPLPMAGLVYAAVGTLYYEANDLDRAHDSLTTGIALCRQIGVIVPVLVGQCTLARLHYARGETELAWQTLAAARHLAERSGNQRLIRRVTAVSADLQLRQGHTAAAALALSNLPDAADDRSELENLTVVRLMLEQGRARESLNLLRQLERSARRQDRLGSLIPIYLMQALAHQALNHSAVAINATEQALCLAAAEDYRRVFLDEGPTAVGLLRRCRDVAPEFVGGLLDAFPDGPEISNGSKGRGNGEAHAAPSPLSIEPLVEPLSRAQLRILRLVADGLSNRDIAARLAITEGTTKWHLNQIYSKMNVSRRTQAVAQARQLKLL
jgi:LuxR family maltose regulon positive regulatory protein